MEKSAIRIRILAGLVSVIALIFGGRLFQLGVLEGKSFLDLSITQVNASGDSGPFERGDIYFEDKTRNKVTAAGLGSGFVLAIKPNIIKNTEDAYNALHPYLLDLDRESFFAKAGKSSDPYEVVAHRLSTTTATAIGKLKLPFIVISPEQWRNYPADSLAAGVLGFVGYKDNQLVGQYGIEREFEGNLSKDASSLYHNFFADLFTGVGKEVFTTESTDKDYSKKGDVVLTIDPAVQALAESITQKTIAKWNASKAGMIVIDPKSGEIRALAMAPTFDPNNYQKEKDPAVYKNLFVEDVFEMGSIMKPITIASGIDLGLINAGTTYKDDGFLELDGKRIENFDGKGRGVVTMQDVLNQSLNTGAAFAALKMGAEKFKMYIERFGLADRTGIDLPNEAGNLLSNLDSNRDVEIATASFGQGIAVTPISMVRALGALANDGYLIKPHVVKYLEYEDGLRDVTRVTEQGRAISSAATEEITRMLVKVVDEYLANRGVKMDHYSIAAKTGTAQIADPVNGGYYRDQDHYMHTFFGYFPAYEPRYLVFLYLYEPKGVRYASETLSMPFKEMVTFLISYYDIPPDR